DLRLAKNRGATRACTTITPLCHCSAAELWDIIRLRGKAEQLRSLAGCGKPFPHPARDCESTIASDSPVAHSAIPRSFQAAISFELRSARIRFARFAADLE